MIIRYCREKSAGHAFRLSDGISALPCGETRSLCMQVVRHTSEHHLQAHKRCLVGEAIN